MSAFDPKRTFRLQILTSIKFKVIAHELSSITDWLSAKRRPSQPSAELLPLPPDPLLEPQPPEAQMRNDANDKGVYVDFPPRQKPGSFSLDQVLAKLQEGGG